LGWLIMFLFALMLAFDAPVRADPPDYQQIAEAAYIYGLPLIMN